MGTLKVVEMIEDKDKNLGSIRIPKDVLEAVKDEKQRLRKLKQEEPSYARLMAHAWAVYEEVRRISDAAGITITEALVRFAESQSVKLQKDEKKLLNFPGSLDILNAPDQEILEAFIEVFQRGDATMKARLRTVFSLFQENLRAKQITHDQQRERPDEEQDCSTQQGSGSR